MKKAVITDYDNKIMLAVFDDDVLSSLQFFLKTEEMIENVYLCRVCNMLPNIEACFVQYQKGMTGFLKSGKYKQEQFVPLQLKKEATGNKEPLFTDKITLSSTYCVVSDGPFHIGVSAKINDEKAKDFENYFNKYSNTIKASVIIRTNAMFADIQVVEEDVLNMSEQLFNIHKNASSRSVYSLLYKAQPGYIKELLNIRSDNLCEIITDIDYIKEELCETFKNKNAIDVKFYNDDLLPLIKLYGIERKIKEATSRTVYLKSGAQIVIDRTEALVAIDVNTYHSSAKGEKEDTFFETNLEAAHEIMRQIKLRNLSGMIVVDFINMKLTKHYEELMDTMRELAQNDSVGVKIIDLTELKLVEIVRTKKHKSLYEQLRCK